MTRISGNQQMRISFSDPFLHESDWTSFDTETLTYLSVPAHLNGAPVRGVIDTGASRSVISPKMLRRLGLARAGTALAALFTTHLPMPLYRAQNLRAGRIAVTGLDIACHDLSIIERAFPGECPMLLGQDFLRRSVLECQFPRNRLRISATLEPDAAHPYHRLTLGYSRYGLPVVPIEIENRLTARAAIDLGSGLACAISSEYAREKGLLQRDASTTLTAGLEGDEAAQLITLSSLQIGGHELRDVPACVISNWCLDDPIHLGLPAFAAFDLAFVRGQDLLVRADADGMAQPIPRDRSGIGAQRFSDHLLIRHVSLNSPAAEEGLVEGDRIVALDGRPIALHHPAPGKRFGRGSAGTRVAITVDDGRAIDLVLRDYF